MKSFTILLCFVINGFYLFAQTQLYNHPKNGYGCTILFEGNFTNEGSAYFHNWWGNDSLTSGANLYKQTLLSNYTSIGVTGIGAEAWLQNPSWNNLDQAYNYARQHNLRYRSNFGPGYYTPTWITGTLAQKRAQYLNRITEILSRYPDTDEWNFCNEITSNNNLNNLLGWTDVEMIVNISQHARYVLDSICSDAKLLTNDYNIITTQQNWTTTHRDAYIQLYVDALAQGAALDYVGLEGHVFCWSNNPVGNFFSSNIDYWRSNAELIDSLIGLPIVFTEFDISMPWDVNTHAWYVNPTQPYTDPVTGTNYNNLWDWQAYAYKSALDTLRSFPNVENITTAGFDDGEMAWNPWVGLLFAIGLNDVNINPKPAYNAISPIFQDHVQLPKAAFKAIVDTIPGTRKFDASGSVDRNGTIISYAWDFGDGNLGSGMNTSHTYSNPGSYAVKLVVTDNDNNTDTSKATISVCWGTQIQNSTIIQGDSLLVYGNYYSVAGTYNILITDSMGCNVVCDTILQLNLSVNMPTGINDQTTENDVTVFPNPAHNIFYITGKNIQHTIIMSTEGKIIDAPLISSNNNIQINVSDITKGLYFLTITTSENTFIKKLIIE